MMPNNSHAAFNDRMATDPVDLPEEFRNRGTRNPIRDFDMSILSDRSFRVKYSHIVLYPLELGR